MLELLTRAEAYGGAATRTAHGISINSPSEISPASSIKIELALGTHTPTTYFVPRSGPEANGALGDVQHGTVARALP